MRERSTRTFAVSADGSTTLVGSGWAGGAGGVLLEWDFQGGRMGHLTADGPLTDSRNPGGALTPGARYKVEVTALDVGTQVGDQVSLLCTAPVVVDCAPETAGASTYDVDGDRLPDVYENEILGTDPKRRDTDCDGASDTIEVASGSSPIDPAQTPDSLPGGKPATKIDGRGDAGVTCGTTKFEWRTPALDKLGVPKGKRGCILLLSNDTANAVIDFVLKHDKATVTTALAKFAGDHLGEVYGDETVDWTAEYKFDRKLKKAKRQAKKALYRAFNLTRINSFFLAGRVAGLHGVALGAVWALNQIRNNDACVQVRVAEGKTGRYRLSWSLVYSRDQLTKAGLKDDLHYAGTWRRNEKKFALDEAVRANTNLTCDRGDVRATGGGASEVFNDAVSFVF